MNIINLTPHDINILTQQGTLSLPKSDKPARVTSQITKFAELNCNNFIIPVNERCFGVTENLPDPVDNTIFIVSRIVAEANTDRLDIYIVDDTVRDDMGNIIGCKALAVI